MTWIKICGIRTLEEARAVQQAGAAAYGQVFAPSPRRISPEDAARINRSISGESSRWECSSMKTWRR